VLNCTLSEYTTAFSLKLASLLRSDGRSSIYARRSYIVGTAWPAGVK
jgi:hypothetical protein